MHRQVGIIARPKDLAKAECFPYPSTTCSLGRHREERVPASLAVANHSFTEMLTMPGYEASDSRARRYQTIVLHAAAQLASGDVRPKTLHMLRTHLRRLQAYLELIGEDQNAEIMARCVSKVSPLRTLQVFERYLARLGSPRSDRRKVEALIQAARAKLKRNHRYRKIERLVRHHGLPPTPGRRDWMARRLAALRSVTAETLLEMIAEAAAHPRRRALHALRLKVKSVRYQEEWTLGQPFARPDLVSRLKQTQTVLGDYEERAQFRKLAAKLNLKSAERIEKDWRRSRAQARAVPADLRPVAESMAGRHLRLVRSAAATPRPKVARPA